MVNDTDQCVFNKMVEGTQCTASFHVDDIFLTHVSEQVRERMVSAFLKVELDERTVIYMYIERGSGADQASCL